ncbi:MAG: GyrI-like domain-containing protein [Dehalococcoidales bacterium]|nr:MAG: GyrI-like domain-containing protein [Dehalococcoidales bacterium]
MEKVDFKKKLKHLYNPSSKEVGLVDIPEMNFVMIDGSGDPNTAQEYQEAIEVLFSLSYAIKFLIKKNQEIDYGVMPLEGLWWTDDMSQFSIANKDIWRWTAMIMQPEYVTPVLFQDACLQVEKKKKLSGISKARFQSFDEGNAVQIMHIGPYSAEGPTIEQLHIYARDHEYTFDGLTQKHHEIYLNDYRKTSPEKLKTIIRQPVNIVCN